MLSRVVHPKLQASIRTKVGLSIDSRFGDWVGRDFCCRFYVRSVAPQGVSATASAALDEESEIRKERRRKSEDYNNRRAAYNREVSKLRKEYADEVAAQRIKAQAEKEKKQQEIMRLKLERQRKKNIRSGLNMLLQEERRKKQALVYQKHLEQERIKREAREERYRAARQLAIDELEKDSHLWLSTPEEVEAAFTPEAQQLLWARPQGVLGSPNPSLDCHFWQHQTHTNKITKIYKSRRQYLLEWMEAKIYEKSNVDPHFWTPERVAEATQIEERARLRADVQVVGRKELLKKQADLIESQYGTKSAEVPKPKPAPSLDFLADSDALEKEGTKVLMNDPTKFFVFDRDDKLVEAQSRRSRTTYDGPTLGTPIGLRKIGKNVFPLLLGEAHKADARSEKEKKQAEREERLLAAARAKVAEEKGVEYVVEDQLEESLPDVNYETVVDSDAKEWEKGVDPHTEEGKAILNVPPALRFQDDDVKWVSEQLKLQLAYHERTFRSQMENLQANTRSRLQYERKKSGEDQVSDEMFPDLELERILLSMPADELLELSNLDDAYELNPAMDNDELLKAAAKIPSLSPEQLNAVLQRDRTFEPSDPLQY